MNIKRVILLKNYNDLIRGTELFYNKENDTFGYEEIEETIGDNVRSVTSRSVAFSSEWVKNLMGKLFSNPDEEVAEEAEHLKIIKQYETHIQDMQEELKRIKNY